MGAVLWASEVALLSLTVILTMQTFWLTGLYQPEGGYTRHVCWRSYIWNLRIFAGILGFYSLERWRLHCRNLEEIELFRVFCKRDSVAEVRSGVWADYQSAHMRATAKNLLHQHHFWHNFPHAFLIFLTWHLVDEWTEAQIYNVIVLNMALVMDMVSIGWLLYLLRKNIATFDDCETMCAFARKRGRLVPIRELVPRRAPAAPLRQLVRRRIRFFE